MKSQCTESVNQQAKLTVPQEIHLRMISKGKVLQQNSMVFKVGGGQDPLWGSWLPKQADELKTKPIEEQEQQHKEEPNSLSLKLSVLREANLAIWNRQLHISYPFSFLGNARSNWNINEILISLNYLERRTIRVPQVLSFIWVADKSERALNAFGQNGQHGNLCE